MQGEAQSVAVHHLAVELALELHHTFTDVPSMTPGPETQAMAERITRKLREKGVVLMMGYDP